MPVGSDIRCKVIGMVNSLQLASRRPGVKACPPGTKLYYLWHEPTRVFYHECYVSEKYAIELAATLAPPSSMSDVAQAWRAEMKHCQHSWKGHKDE